MWETGVTEAQRGTFAPQVTQRIREVTASDSLWFTHRRFHRYSHRRLAGEGIPGEGVPVTYPGSPSPPGAEAERQSDRSSVSEAGPPLEMNVSFFRFSFLRLKFSVVLQFFRAP